MQGLANNSIATSIKRYYEAKLFFLSNEEMDFVVEISEGPLARWTRTYFSSIEHMGDIRAALSAQGKAFCGYVHCEGHYSFYYKDNNVFISQDAKTNEIYIFNDLTFQYFNIGKVIAELKLLHGW